MRINLTDFFRCGPLYFDGVSMVFQARMIDTLPGTNERVAYGIERFVTSDAWVPVVLREHHYPDYVVMPED